MGIVTTKQQSFTDDLADGASLPAGQRTRIMLTDGRSVWYVDTARSNEIVTQLKQAGTKQKQRGRKPKAS